MLIKAHHWVSRLPGGFEVFFSSDYCWHSCSQASLVQSSLQCLDAFLMDIINTSCKREFPKSLFLSDRDSPKRSHLFSPSSLSLFVSCYSLPFKEEKKAVGVSTLLLQLVSRFYCSMRYSTQSFWLQFLWCWYTGGEVWLALTANTRISGEKSQGCYVILGMLMASMCFPLRSFQRICSRVLSGLWSGIIPCPVQLLELFMHVICLSPRRSSALGRSQSIDWCQKVLMLHTDGSSGV